MKKKNQSKADLFRANSREIDWKDVQVLKRFVSSYGKIAPRRRTGLSASMQRQLSKAIKQARQAGIMSSTNR